MRCAILLALTATCLPASEVASVDAFGRLFALFSGGETFPLSSDIKVEADGKELTLRDADPVKVERTPDGGTWRGSVNGLAFTETVEGTRLRFTFTAERDIPAAAVSFYVALPRSTFSGGTWNDGAVRLTGTRPAGDRVASAAISKFDFASGPVRFESVLDQVRKVDVYDLWLRPGRFYVASVTLHNGPLALGATFDFETTLAVELKPDRTSATLSLDASKVRYRFQGFGGNYCFSTDSPVTEYTLENLRSAWARIEMNSREWEPENDDVSPLTTNWSVFKTRDIEGTKLHRDFLLARKIQSKKIPYAISVWSLPEWLYSDPDQQAFAAHRRRVPPEKWDELLEHVGSYLTYAKQQYGVEPDLFSFNEANIGVNVLFTPEEHREAIKSIGTHLKKLGLKTKMLLGDATGPRDTHLWALPAANDPEALANAGAIAFHSWEGGTPAQYAAWGDLAEWVNLPLLVAEVGVDAFAWRNRTFDTFHYGMREVEMYQELLLYARPQAFLQWEYTGDYGLAHAVRKGDGTVEVQPTPRFWFLKQFSDRTPMHSDALATTSNHAKVLFTAFAGLENGRRVHVMHVANLGAAREITIAGIPAGIPSLKAVRTAETEAMKDAGTVPVTEGVARFRVPELCLVTLSSE